MRERPLSVLKVVLVVLGMAVASSAETINIGMSGTATQESNLTSGGVTYIAAWGNNGDYGEKGPCTSYGSTHLNPWWQVDMGSATAVDEVWVFYRTPARTAQRAYNLSLQVLDGSGNSLYNSADYGIVFNPWDGTGTSPKPIDVCGLAPAKFTVPSSITTGQKFRINKVGYRNLPASYDETIDTWEVEVRADDGLTSPNVAKGAPVTVFGDGYYQSSSYYSPPSALTDDSVGTYSSSDTEVPDPNTFGYLINLGSSQALTQIKVYPRQEAAIVGGGTWAKRLGDYVVSLYADDDGAPAATANWTYTRTGTFAGALGTADIFTAQWAPARSRASGSRSRRPTNSSTTTSISTAARIGEVSAAFRSRRSGCSCLSRRRWRC